MPRDNWNEARRKTLVGRVREERAKTPMGDLDHRKLFYLGAQGAVDSLLANHLIAIDEIGGKKILVFADEGDARLSLNALQFNFRRGRNNPVQVRGGEIHVDAAKFFGVTQRID